MGILMIIVKILASWSFISTVSAFALAAAISKGEQVRRDDFLVCVFATIESLQESRS